MRALYSRFKGIAVSGWTSLTIVVLFFGSAILPTLGLIGIYLMNIYDELKGWQPYIVAESIDAACIGVPRGDRSV